MKSRQVKEVIVIVGAYSTGRFLAPIFYGYGYYCIHIHPHIDMDKEKNGYHASSDLYVKEIWHDGDLEHTIYETHPYTIKFVIAGSEGGVYLADLLNNALSLPFANLMISSVERRNKYLMQESIKNYGLASIPQYLSNNVTKILEWINTENKYPTVIKPINSCNADGVSFCQTDNDVIEACARVLEAENIFGEVNTHIIVQQRLIGIEYVVNTVSYDGIHIVTDIWSNHKKDDYGQSIYDYQELLDPIHSHYANLVEYTQKVLTSLDIQYGAGHSEIMFTTNGPILIETGARLGGDFYPSITMEALGFSQVSKLVDMYIKRENYLMNNNLLTPRKKALIVSLISNKEGAIQHDINMQDFFEIEGFHSIQVNLQIGSSLKVTIDLTSSPGNVYFIADTDQILQSAYRKIRELERNMYKNLL